jgi:sarcosine oxidase, subunit beta
MTVLPHRPELRASYDVAIVGAGVHGLSLAYHLARSGRTSVAVFERGYLGVGASGRNMTLLRSSWSQRAWAELIWYARGLWRTISLELGTNVMFTERGSYLCLDEESAAAVAPMLVMHRELGIPTEFVGGDELAERLPQLDVRGLAGAVHDPAAGISRHDALVWGYARAAAGLGVHMHPFTAVTGVTVGAGGRVTGVRTTKGAVASEIVVNCAGSASAEVGSFAGVVVPTRTMALEMFVTEPFEPYLTPAVSLLPDQAYVIQTSRGEFVGGAEPVGHFAEPRLTTTYAALRRSAAVFARRLPALRGVNVLRMWSGLIDLGPDGAGLVGEIEERPGFYLECGWGGEGYMVSVATGPLGAAYVNTGVLDRLLRPFHYSRFDTGERLDDAMLVVDAAGEVRGAE